MTWRVVSCAWVDSPMGGTGGLARDVVVLCVRHQRVNERPVWRRRRARGCNAMRRWGWGGRAPGATAPLRSLADGVQYPRARFRASRCCIVHAQGSQYLHNSAAAVRRSTLGGPMQAANTTLLHESRGYLKPKSPHQDDSIAAVSVLELERVSQDLFTSAGKRQYFTCAQTATTLLPLMCPASSGHQARTSA